MSYKDITAGRKVATLEKARFIQSRTGKMAIELAFKFKEKVGDREQTEYLQWQGWLTQSVGDKQGALENTMRTLVEVVEFNGDETHDDKGVLTNPEAFNFKKEVELVVEIETYKNEAGEEKQGPRVKWVNNVGGSAYSTAQPEVIKTELGKIGFRAAFLAAQQQTPANPSKGAGAPAAPEPEKKFDESVVPF